MKNRIILILLFSFSYIVANAWSDKEHRMMAYMAEEHLTDNTKEFLSKYLDQSIVEYSVWMDVYRNAPGYAQTTKWHMVTVGEDGKSFPAGHEGQAAQALAEAFKVLSDYKEYNDSTVHINLIMLIHLVPEIHCPAHYYFLEFGNDNDTKQYTFMPIKYNGAAYTYHKLWDDAPSLAHVDENLDMSKSYYDIWDDAKRKEVSEGGIQAWLLDNAQRIRQIHKWVSKDQSIDRQFLLDRQEFIDTQVRLGSARLERILNDLFDSWKEN